MGSNCHQNYYLLMARRATYVVDGRFFAHFFWKVEGTVCIHINSRVAHVAILDLMSGSHLELLKMAAT